MTNKKDTFTTCQAFAAVAVFAAKQLQQGEDVRKIYPAEGTGCGSRWVDLVMCCEIADAETGEYLREEYYQVFKTHQNHAAKLTAVKWN